MNAELEPDCSAGLQQFVLIRIGTLVQGKKIVTCSINGDRRQKQKCGRSGEDYPEAVAAILFLRLLRFTAELVMVVCSNDILNASPWVRPNSTHRKRGNRV